MAGSVKHNTASDSYITTSAARSTSAELSDGAEFFHARRLAVLSQRGLRPTAKRFTSYAPPATVVMLNFNGQAVLRRSLEAVLNQDYPNFTLVVVDNASSDTSRQILCEFEASYTGRIKLVFLSENRGVAGGRNAAIPHCDSDFVAFIDNDGYPDPNWLSEAVWHLTQDRQVGAVAPLVFFASRETLLNGSGGCREPRGFAGDVNFSQPVEFANLNCEVLYPMGCGMVLTRTAVESSFPLDALLPKWFDDVEVGERVWRSGMKVAICKYSHVLHGFHGSDDQLSKGNWRKALLFHKARIRHSIKYPPQGGLPRLLLHEMGVCSKMLLSKPKEVAVAAAAWCWNLLHIASALKVESEFASNALTAQRRYVDGPVRSGPDNHSFQFERSRLGSSISFERSGEEQALRGSAGGAELPGAGLRGLVRQPDD